MKKTGISFLCCLWICGLGFAQLPEHVEKTIRQRVDGKYNVGIVLGYIEDGETTYFSYGKTALKDGTEVDEKSVFEIGSISKVFTTILLADQVLQGNMALDDPIARYLPEDVKVPQRNGKRITLKDLATHTSGLPRMPTNFRPVDANNPFLGYEKEQIYEFLTSYELPRDIGVQYEYSNFGMGLLGHLLELQSGKPYETLVSERISSVNGMTDTGRALRPAMKERLAKGHAYGSEVRNWDITGLAGAGGLRSTAADMVQFIAANMKSAERPMEKAMELSHKTAFQDADSDFKIGLGWHFANAGTVLWHNGGTGGYRAFAGFHPQRQVGVVVLTNCLESVDDIGLHLLDSSNELSRAYDPVAEKTVATALLKTYEGRYEFSPAFAIEITREENQLFLQATGQQRFPVFPSAEDTFFLKVVAAHIVFNKDEAGNVISLTLHQNGQSPVGKKVE